MAFVDSSNAVADLARAPVIARMDADDVSHPTRLARQLEALERDPEAAAIGTLFRAAVLPGILLATAFAVGVVLMARLWPSYVAYVVSFVTIGIIWVNHHAIFRLFEGVDRTMLFLNVLFLMVVAFIPFPTEVVADNVRDPGSRRAAALLYGSNMILLAVGFVVLWVYGSRRLLSAELRPSI